MMDPNNIKPVVFDAKFMIPNEVVDDVICRFLLNIPKEEKFDPIRVCFQVELARWFFLDYYCGEGCSPRLAQLRNMPYSQFAYIMFQKTPHLKAQLSGIEMHLAAFREYKMRVPTYGAILMNQSLTKAVLNQGFRNQWGFPKGKVNEVEDPVNCAIREVFEETGYDISPLVNETHYIESKFLERNDRLYLVRGVDRHYDFQPQTQFEIKDIRWFNISELPEHKKDTNPATLKSGVPISNFYTVYPYVKRFKMRIADKLEGKNKVHHFKVRPEPGENQNQIGSVNTYSSNQRNVNKGPQQTSDKNKNLETFQFPLQFLQSGGGSSVTAAGGWQLLPEQKPYMMNSNALQELLFSPQNQSQNQQLQNQNRLKSSQGTNNTNTNASAKVNKNPRRRLFSAQEELAQGALAADSGIIGIGKPATGSSTSFHHHNATGSTESSVRKPLIINAAAWNNFSFDRERLYKAFFTPPPNPVSMR